MKSKHLTIITVLFLSSLAVYSQSISNSGFENWTFYTFYEDPVGFSSTNAFTFENTGEPNARKTADSYSGDFALEVETVNTTEGPFSGAVFIGGLVNQNFTGGVPFTERPDSIKGFVKYNVMPTDTAYVLVMFKLFNNPIGICMAPFIGSQEDYTEFSAPIQWLIPIVSPDTMLTGITSSALFNLPISGSTLKVDSIHFIGATTPYPNNDFEDWVEYSSEEPDDWFTSNALSFSAGETPVTKTEDSYEGNYAVRIENTLTIWDDTLGFITNGTLSEEGPIGGLAIDSVPDIISGYYKYIPVGPDTAYAAVSLFYYNEITGTRELLEEQLIPLTEASEYTYFEIPVDYYALPEPDTLNIAFAAGNVDFDTTYIGLGSALYIDDLDVTYKSHITGINNDYSNNDVNVYPNPASSQLFLEMQDFVNNDIEVSIINSNGSIVYNNIFNSTSKNQLNIDVNGFKPGVYFYIMKVKDKNYNGKFIVK